MIHIVEEWPWLRMPEMNWLERRIADTRAFSFPERAFDFSFVTNQDLNPLENVDEVERALASIHRHLRAIAKSGSLAAGEFSDRRGRPWKTGDGDWIIERIK